VQLSASPKKRGALSHGLIGPKTVMPYKNDSGFWNFSSVARSYAKTI